MEIAHNGRNYTNILKSSGWMEAHHTAGGMKSRGESLLFELAKSKQGNSFLLNKKQTSYELFTAQW